MVAVTETVRVVVTVVTVSCVWVTGRSTTISVVDCIRQRSGRRDGTLATLTVSLPLRIRPADLKNRLIDAPPRELLFFLELPRS